MRHAVAAVALMAIAACSRGTPVNTSGSGSPDIHVAEQPAGTATVDVVGLPAGDVASLRHTRLTQGEWNALLRVRVDTGASGDGDLPPMSGAYSIAGSALRFVPDFPLDRHVGYRVIFDPASLPRGTTGDTGAWRARPIEFAIAARAAQGQPTTRVAQVFPTDVLLENQLRIYVHFSAPMGIENAGKYVRLLDENDDVVRDAFLPLDVSFWNADRTRFTLLFDPGRVKRGILPNRQMGRPLVRGRRYTLVVDREWRDAQGRPLVEAFRREFQVAPALFEPIVPGEWRLQPPTAGTRALLNIDFPRPLDHAIVQKVLVVTDAQGHVLEGKVTVDDAATRWTFMPRDLWRSGELRLVALSVLEDPAGNRIGRAFDFDPRGAGSEEGGDAHAQAVIPFQVREDRR